MPSVQEIQDVAIVTPAKSETTIVMPQTLEVSELPGLEEAKSGSIHSASERTKKEPVVSGQAAAEQASSNLLLPEETAVEPTCISSEHTDEQQDDSAVVPYSQHMSIVPVSSQSHKHKMDSFTYNVESLQHKDGIKMGLMYAEHLNLDQQLQVSSELMYQLHVNSDIIHPQNDGSEIEYSQFQDSPVAGLDNSQAVSSGMADMQIVAVEMVNHNPLDPESQPNKCRKKKSVVWEYFTIENVGDGCRRAYCKACKQSFAYSTGSKVAGTSHLKRHIAKGSCSAVLRPHKTNNAEAQVGKLGNSDSSKKRRRNSSTQDLFDEDRARREITKMIIMHDCPLNMIEHQGFVAFVQHLQPRFDMVSFDGIQGECMAFYMRERQKLQSFIEEIPGRLCLTLDMRTSNQTTGYVFVHGQFVDNEWKLHRRLLKVVMEPFPESDTALSRAVATCHSDWNLNSRLCSITFSLPVNDTGRENMRVLLSHKNPLILNGQLLVGSCIARTLSSMAGDALVAGQDTVRRIRSSVKYIKASDALEHKFLEVKEQLQVTSERIINLDNLTKWNTTYEMLVAACEVKEVFTCMDRFDPGYKDPPSVEEWKRAENICVHLELLLRITNLLSSNKPVSTNVFFHEVWTILLELNRNASSDDPFVRLIAKPMQEKFLKYWKDSFLVLAVAVAMDPRFKMKLVEFSFTKLFGNDAYDYIRVVKDSIHELFQEYVASPLALQLANENRLESVGSANCLSDFETYIRETTSRHMKLELDQYLDESLVPRLQELDILDWWRLNELKYPALSRMARDVLSIPLSSVGPDSLFDTIGVDINEYQSSLRPETFEALMCARNWLQQSC